MTSKEALEKEKLIVNLNVAKLLAHKRRKFIKIVKNKTIYLNIMRCTNNCLTYNSLMDYEEDKLKEAEYQLIKEVLEDEL